VDLDLQRPQVAGYFGLKIDRGLGDYLVGEAELDQIIYNAGVERLAVIPNYRSFEHSSELLLSPRMHDLTQALAADAPRRIVIFDMPPLLASDDVLAFAPQVDGLLLVVSEGITARGSLEKSRELLGETNVVGIVLNQSAERNDSQYY
jgi:Mrp family chromosome partitioning ATPase